MAVKLYQDGEQSCKLNIRHIVFFIFLEMGSVALIIPKNKGKGQTNTKWKVAKWKVAKWKLKCHSLTIGIWPLNDIPRNLIF